MTVTGYYIIRFLIAWMLEAGHGHALLSKDLRVHLILRVFLLDLRSLVHEQIEELLALFLHVALIVVNEQWLHDELVKSMQILGATRVVSLRFRLLVIIFLIRVQHVLVRAVIRAALIVTFNILWFVLLSTFSLFLFFFDLL